MDNKYLVREPKDRHLQLWIYLLPIVGIIPAIWTLSQNKGNREQLKASRLSITLALTWIIIYSFMSLSVNRASDILAFRLLYLNALLTTGYFITCTVLMLRLRKGALSRLFKIGKFAERDRG